MAKKITRKEKKEIVTTIQANPAQKKGNVTPEKPGMINWLCVLLIILPILFSRTTIDPVISIRYIFLSGFLLLFVLFFFLIKKNPPSLTLSRLPVIVFGLGFAFITWIVVTLPVAINTAEVYYQACKHGLFLVLLFVITVAVRNEEFSIIKIGKAIVILSFIQSFAGILQYYDIAFTDLPGANAKPFGLMANRNLFGSGQMLLIPFVLYCFYKAGKAWKYISALAVILIVISLIISQTRSAWVGSLAIITASLILVSIFDPSLRKKWLIATISGIGIAGVLIFILAVSDTEGELSSSLKERAASLTFKAGDTTQQASSNVNERVKIWQRTLNMIKDHPYTGVGAGNWRISIPPYGGSDVVWSYGKFIPDKPHNVYLHVLSENGIPGAVLYFGSWLLISFIGWKVISKTQNSDRRIVVILMLSGLLGFACDGFFSFPTERFEHCLYMVLMAGIILAGYSNEKFRDKTNVFSVNKPIAVAAIVIISFNLLLAFKKYNFEVHMNRAKAYEKLSRYQEILNEVEEGQSDLITVDPDNKPLQMYAALAYKGLKDYPKAISAMNKATRYNPNSALIYNNLATIYTEMKQYDSAIVNCKKALAITPNFEIGFKNLAVNYFLSGNYAGCIEAIGKINLTGDQYFTGMLAEAKRLQMGKK